VRQGRKVGAVKTESGQSIAGDSFVLATGATVTDLLRKSELGIQVQRVFYGVGVSLEIKSPDFPHQKCIRTPNRGLACGLYSTPYFLGADRPNDHILIGASNFISPTPYPNGRLTSVDALMRGAIEQINSNFYRADLVRVNVGWRPTTLDTYPLLGRTSIDNLIIATGTKRDGFHLAPLLSEKIVAMLLGEPVNDGFARFAPERAPIRTLSRSEAIDKAVRHLISASYQHGFTPARSRMPAQIAQMHRDDLERLHDKVGALDWGIPPEMLDMYRYGHTQA
jgi:glycine/D-amino acid oxidase-like deaminating enzyme